MTSLDFSMLAFVAMVFLYQRSVHGHFSGSERISPFLLIGVVIFFSTTIFEFIKLIFFT